MKAGRSSRTAALVCKARAYAHALRLGGFADATAAALLDEADRQDLERELARPASKAMAHVQLAKRAAMMAVRTMSIDEVVRDANAPQVVILGAGLDGRAWRMPELKDAIVFEVDHPDTQRDKRVRIASLAQSAREVRFTAVDFAKDDLARALEDAGHDPARPTTWLWEGVVMYLAPADVERTLVVVQERSAPGSRIAILYHAPGLILPFVGFFVRMLGEPLQSIFRPNEMKALLARFGFSVVRDESIPEATARIAPVLSADVKVMGHLRVVDGRFA